MRQPGPLQGDRKLNLNSASDDLVRRSGLRRHQQHSVQQLVPVAVVRETLEIVHRVQWDRNRHGHRLHSPQSVCPLGTVDHHIEDRAHASPFRCWHIVSMTFIGVDLGGTKLAVAAFTGGGEVIEREVTALSGREGGAVGSIVAERVERMRAKHGSKAVGVCVPGLYRAERGTVWAPNIGGWDDYPLLEELRGSLGHNVRVTIDSDRAAYILGETWRRSARGARDAIFLAVGTGIGAGILAGERIVRGHGDLG